SSVGSIGSIGGCSLTGVPHCYNEIQKLGGGCGRLQTQQVCRGAWKPVLPRRGGGTHESTRHTS
ncbi:MAG: hypothetical protein KBG77_09235, partial [Dermatophilaceae bacterium]|nr:hypothetical protein [Dermatophilaceae bacterium]